MSNYYFKLPVSLSLIALLMISVPGNDTILQQANAITFNVNNLGLSADALAIEGNIIKFTVSEEHQETDLNGDGDTDDEVFHVYNHLDGVIINLELADSRSYHFPIINDNLIVLLVNEENQGNTDLNGDGDTDDFNVIHIYDHSTGTTTNLGLSLDQVSIFDTGILYGNLIVFTVDESSQGNTDLNGDGDTDDFNVIHIYDHSTGTTTNLKIDGSVDNIDGNLIAFTVHESFQGNTDLNGDGDTRDGILHIYDPSTGEITNLELVSEPPSIDGNLVAFLVNERAQGDKDLNGDIDRFDEILHIYDHSTGVVTNLKIASEGVLILDNNLVAFDVSERFQGRIDLNGDGDIDDSILHIYDHSTGVVTNSEINGALLDVNGNMLPFLVPEDLEGRIDLNGDGDTDDDYVLHIYDHSTGSITNLDLAVFFNPRIDGNLVVFVVNEQDQGNTDLNDDGDTDDSILHVYDHSTGSIINLQIGGFPTLDGNLVAFTVDEFSQGNTDLNKDGDTRDEVLHIYDHSTGSIINVELAGRISSIDDNLVAFSLNEFSQGNTDLNKDGDTDDQVLHIIELTGDELFCGQPLTSYVSVIEGTNDDDVLLGTPNNDLIFGMDGNDLIFASNGNDCVYGGPGNDSIFGRGGNDMIFGEDGDDTLFGAMGDDMMDGGAGSDHLMDDFGNDTLDGGEDDDLCYDKYGNNDFTSCEIKFE